MSNPLLKKFMNYAAQSLARWKLIEGRKIVHQTFGPGIIRIVQISNGDVTIRVAFEKVINSDGSKDRVFGTRVFYEVTEIDLPTPVIEELQRSHPHHPGKAGSPPPGRPASTHAVQRPKPGSHGPVRRTEYVIPPPGSARQTRVEDPPPAAQAPAQPAGRPAPRFQPNQLVRVRQQPNRRGMVKRARIFAVGEWQYEVFFSFGDEPVLRESDLELCEERLEWGTRDDLLRDLAVVKLRRPLSDNLYALYASRTQFEVYQFKPALKFLGNPDQRLLIADEVGLGKTIEAGIIYLELHARLGLERVLIVCPSSLRQKWQDEMKSRFDEEFAILDLAGVKRFLEQYRQYGSATRLRGIVSLELIRRRDLAEALNDVRLDLVIIDEAHHCRNTATLANAVASVLSDNADAALLLTATPLQMGNEDLFNLLNILSEGEFDNYQAFLSRLEPNQYINRAAQILSTGDRAQALKELRQVEGTSERQRFQGSPYYKEVVRMLERDFLTQQEMVTVQRRLLELNTLSSVFTRTRKRDVQEKAPLRTAHTLPVTFTPAERRFYQQMIEEVRREYILNHGQGQGSGWVTIMKERQVASCISAMQRRYNREGWQDIEVYPEDESFEGNFYNGEPAEDSNAALFDEFSFVDGAVQVRNALRVTRAFVPVQVDSKFDVFWKALQAVLEEDPKTKVLVFSFFRETIDYLQERLGKLRVNVRAIHGGYKVIDRYKIIEEFRDDPAIRVLVSSDVGSEGLDFQFCDTLFNYDLPWNPMKVEQRIGRIDRFGQESERVRIYNLVIEDTVESRILMRLYDRIEIFKRSIGDIEAILGEQIRELTNAVFSRQLSAREEEEQAERSIRNILRQKQDIEEFEQKKLQFLGQEAIFSTTIENTIESGRFVSEPEVYALVSGYLRERFPLSRLRHNGPDDATYTLDANDDLVAELRTYIFQQRKNDQTAMQFLQKLRPGQEIPITFSSKLAYQRKLLEFLTPRHPLAQAALEHWKKQTDGQKRLARIEVNSQIAPPGRYLFFIFSFDSEGIDKETRLVPVAVSCETGDVHSALSKQLLRLVQTAAPPAGSAGYYEQGELDQAEESAMLYMTNERDALDRDLTESNEALVNARLAAIEQSYQAKKKRIESIRQKVSNVSIQRMHAGQLRNIEAKYLARKREIESKRNVAVRFSLELKGCMEIV